MNAAEHLWARNKPLAIALLVVIAAVIYFMYTKAKSAIVAPVAAAPTSAVGPGGTFTNTYDTTTVNNPALPIPSKPSPIPPIAPLTWLPKIPNGSKLIPNWGGLPWGWQAPNSKVVNGLNPPAGTRIWQGSAGRWWYAVPGGPQTLLTTS